MNDMSDGVRFMAISLGIIVCTNEGIDVTANSLMDELTRLYMDMDGEACEYMVNHMEVE